MSFEELLTPKTQPEALAELRADVLAAPANIAAEVLDTPTTSEAAIVYALSIAESTRSSDRAFFARSASRVTASDPYVRVIARDGYSLEPKTSTFATTTMEGSNASTLFYGPYEPGQFIPRNSVTKKLYKNVDTISFPAGSSGVTFEVVAIEAGSASSAQPNEITELETPEQGLTVNNPSAALANDDETAEALNGRIDAKIGSLGEPGARGWNTGATGTSFEAVAKNGPDDGGGCVRADGSRIDVTRTQVVRNDVTGVITLYLADDDGPILTDDVAIVREQVQFYTEWLGLTVEVENSTLVTVTYDGTLTISTKGVSATNGAIEAQAQAELTAAGRILQIGEGPTLDYGRDAILDAGNAGKPTAFRLRSLALSLPTTDTVLADGEVVALVLGTLSIVRA